MAGVLNLVEEVLPWSRQVGVSFKLVPPLAGSIADPLEECRGLSHTHQDGNMKAEKTGLGMDTG